MFFNWLLSLLKGAKAPETRLFLKNILHKSPNWLFEAAACIASQYNNDLESIIENHNRFGMTLEEMTETLRKYSRYREKVLSEIMPIYKEYPGLEKYFIDAKFNPEMNNPIAISITMYFGESLSYTFDQTEVDEIINDFITDIINEFSDQKDNVLTEIKNINDVMNHLNKIDMEDASKMQLVNLYYNRYDFIKELASLLARCAPICEKHYSIMKEDFDKALKLLNKADNLNELFSSYSFINVNLSDNFEIYPNIFCFNGMSMIEGKDHFIAYIGIYFFDYMERKTKNRFNDNQIVGDLKALGDGTRLKMIHLLAKNKMYVQELAGALELTPATISHHINVLLSSELIIITLDTDNPKKIYYKANEDKITSLGETIKSLINP